MSKFSRLKEALVKALAEFGNITTDKGILAWDGDDDLKEGDSVYIEDAEGNRTPAEDGDYKTEDNKTIVVTDGKVAEIKDPEAEVAPVNEDMAKVSTDKGDLIYEGEEDLKEGDAVFVEQDGENVPAEDGEYKTEDGKVIKVVDGKVESITDAEAEVAPTEAELKARRQKFFRRMKQAFEDSYEEKERKILDAIIETLAVGEYAYLIEAGENYAVVNISNEENWEGTNFKYELSWDESGNVIVGEKEEVKPAFVPVDEPNPADPDETSTSEEEMNRIKQENEDLKKEIAKLKKKPLAKPAHEEVKTTEAFHKTGNKGLDTLARILSAK